MAAAISLRSYLLVTTLSKSHRTITLNFSDIDLNHTWDIDSLPWETFSHPSRKKRYYDMVTALDSELVAAMQPHVVNVSLNAPPAQRKIHQNAASTFLYLFLSLGSPRHPACIYTLRSTIPVGVGLGSSASISVCLATALLIQSRALSGPHPDQLPEEAEKQLERINRWAFVGELAIHGNPSGVDNTVATGGKAVLFKRTDYSKPPLVTPLHRFPTLPLLLVDTRVPKSTAAEVAKVAALKKSHPGVADGILDAIDKITEAAHASIERKSFDATTEADCAELGHLMSVNHGLLAALGVSHPALERLRALVDAAGVGWTKLTGAGGGGCAITLLRPGVDAAKMKELERDLDSEGFKKYETLLGGDGVGVLYPAVLHHTEGEDAGDEIDLEKFERAEGREGVEALVGVGREEREGWKFWRV